MRLWVKSDARTNRPQQALLWISTAPSGQWGHIEGFQPWTAMVRSVFQEDPSGCQGRMDLQESQPWPWPFSQLATGGM